MLELVFRIAKCDRGATAVEYGLIVSLIVIAIIASLGNLAERSSGIWINVSNTFTKNTQ
jgi:pilus assembly protein Flp/PilA